jgi:hypothetical protein
MRNRRIGTAVLALGAAFLAAVWFLIGVHAPPLYDGLVGPSEPYRYLQPPPNHKGGKAPTSVTRSLHLPTHGSPFFVLLTSEQPPQAQLHLDQDAIVSPPGPQTIVFSIHAVPPPSTSPSGGVVEGNVYNFAAVTQRGGPVTFHQDTANLDLRTPNLVKGATIEQYANGQWTRLSTGQFIGTPIYSASIRSLGEFAVIGAGTASGTLGFRSFLPYIIIGAVVVLLAALVLVLVRVARAPANETEPPSGPARRTSSNRNSARNRKRRD